ncbi:MAG: pentapeptide repeat-containing protein [Chloroflexi bacterium]|nr:pentapeptide repeat-containing protein [Chloroflexota bacterium]
MANQEQLEILKQGVEVWNKWREENPNENIDLKGAYLVLANLNGANFFRADLFEANLNGANLREANLVDANLREALLLEIILRKADLRGASLYRANLRGANLYEANLRGANLSRAILGDAILIRAILVVADLSEVNLSEAVLRGADLTKANLTRANLTKADLRGADLRGANFSEASLSETNLSEVDLRGTNLSRADLRGADLSNANLRDVNLRYANFVQTNIDSAKVSNSHIYGISVWDLEGEFEEQKDLVITPEGAPTITVDNIKVAQFVYLILNNEEIRDVINTLMSRAVLILGRFSPERKAILNALKNKLREHNLLPIVFDFDRPTDKDFTETIKTLAGLSYFVIADITNPKSSPLELQATVPDYQIPFVPIIQEGEQPFAMMVDLQKKYNWVLDTLSYSSIDTLIQALKPAIIDPAIQKHNELRLIKAQEPRIRSAEDFIGDKGIEN